MERTGFTYAGDVEHAGLPHVLYRTSPTLERDDSRPRCRWLMPEQRER